MKGKCKKAFLACLVVISSMLLSSCAGVIDSLKSKLLGEDDKPDWKIATTTGDFLGLEGYETDEKIIRGLYEAGFRYIDFSMYKLTPDSAYLQDNWREEVLELKAVADELGMEFVQAHSQGGNPLSGDPEEMEFIVTSTIRSIEICEVLGIKNTVVHAGILHDGSKERWFEENKAFYEKLLPTAERCGVNILCENFTRRSMENRYYIYTGADMREFIEYVDHPNFHGCWDTGHANCDMDDQYDDIMALGDEMYAIHYADNKGDGDTHLLPYCGTLNHEQIIKALIDVNFQGYFTLECDGSGRSNVIDYEGPEFDWMREAFPTTSSMLIPYKMNRVQQEKFLYDIAEYILDQYA